MVRLKFKREYMCCQLLSIIIVKRITLIILEFLCQYATVLESLFKCIYVQYVIIYKRAFPLLIFFVKN